MPRYDIKTSKAITFISLWALNSQIEVEATVAEITKDNVHNVIGDVDVVVDGQDNWKTRCIVNDYCMTINIPFVHVGVYALHGRITTIVPGKGPCL